MALVWTRLALLPLLAGLAAWLVALLVLQSGAGRPQNRRLALVFLLEGGGLLLGATGTLLDDAALVLRLSAIGAALLGFIPLAYLSFVGRLDTPLVRPFRPAWVAALFALAGTAFVVLALVRPGVYLTGVEPFPGGGWGWDLAPGTPVGYFIPGIFLVPLFGLVASLHALRRAAPGSPLRLRARAYAWAFGLRDVLVVLAYVGVLTWQTGPAEALFYGYVFPWVTLLPILVLGYGILKTQLFDIDLRLKWGAARGTAGALMVVLVLSMFKVAESYLGREFGWIFGGASAGIILFLAPRLNRLADRVADKAAPQVSATSEYLTYRKFEVYRAALEGALEDGDVSAGERRMLVRLQANLGIPASDAEALEAELRATARAPLSGVAAADEA